MIPKKIHYCWFGRKKHSVLIKRCINSWKKFCPDYQIIEWNEDNYDLASSPLFVRQAFEAKKWAFVSDFVRYHVVYEYGGIYLDTDVEIIRNIDHLLDNSAFFGLQTNKLPASGLGFGAEKGHDIIKELMNLYMDIPFIFPDGSYDMADCPRRESPIFLKHGFNGNDEEQFLDNNVRIYPTEYFCPNEIKTGELNITSNSVMIHWFAGSWVDKRKKKLQELNKKLYPVLFFSIKIARKILGTDRYMRYKKILGFKKNDSSSRR